MNTLRPSDIETPGIQAKRRERPIIMSGDNPKLILDGRKTQTRRIIKLKFPFAAGIAEVAGYHMGTTPTPPIDMRVTLRRGIYHHMDFKTFAEKYCPYGVAGDRLWVRETFKIRAYGAIHDAELCYSDGRKDYRYIGSDDREKYRNFRGEKKIPSIHMPRWASRITLEITKVRVERLQDISEEDCIAEGVTMINRSAWWVGEMRGTAKFCHANPQLAYSVLWDSLHGKGAWDKNPWVWVIEFRLSPKESSTATLTTKEKESN